VVLFVRVGGISLDVSYENTGSPGTHCGYFWCRSMAGSTPVRGREPTRAITRRHYRSLLGVSFSMIGDSSCRVQLLASIFAFSFRFVSN
jgi:hypothetical protein